MGTSVANQPRSAVGVDAAGRGEDPFTSTTPQFRQSHPHRYSTFDTQLFALNHPSSSPSQAKRALEAHLAETERRLQEASKLGTTLVQQRKILSERLRDVEAHQEDEEIGPELRQRLLDVEREYAEVSRESVRAFIGPKHQDLNEVSSTPFALDGRVSKTNLYTMPPSSLEVTEYRQPDKVYSRSYRFTLKTQRAKEAT